jgi:ketosteroid isomerase-like protein
MTQDSDLNTLRWQLQALADERDVRTLVARLAQAGDSQQIGPYMDVFADDAVFEIEGAARFEGAAQIRAWAEGRWAGPGGPTMRHLITGTVVTLDGDRARARSYFTVITPGDGGLRVNSTGVYEDSFARTSDGWKFVHRKLRNRLG